jgi:hypothetical protein
MDAERDVRGISTGIRNRQQRLDYSLRSTPGRREFIENRLARMRLEVDRGYHSLRRRTDSSELVCPVILIKYWRVSRQYFDPPEGLSMF